MQWLTYVRQTGPLNLGLRLEHGFAMLATVLSSIHGGKAEFSDFLPDRGVRYEDAEGSPEDMLRLLQSLKR
jgi:hypothetical protein